MRKVYKMEDLDCANCAGLMQEEIGKISGVSKVNVNFLMQKMSIELEDDKIDEIMANAQRICKKIEPDCRIVL